VISQIKMAPVVTLFFICPPRQFRYERLIFSTSRLMASWSSVPSGRDRNSPILRGNTKAYSRTPYDRVRCPSTVAGSGFPSGASWAGPASRETLLGPLSHTVKAKFSLGASGVENSSHDLLHQAFAEEHRCPTADRRRLARDADSRPAAP
jgi:hypothetical protein